MEVLKILGISLIAIFALNGVVFIYDTKIAENGSLLERSVVSKSFCDGKPLERSYEQVTPGSKDTVLRYICGK